MKLSSARGLTLVEIVIAALLISTVMTLLLNAFVNANKWISPENNVAHGLARETHENLLEEVRQDRWDDNTRRIHPDFDPPAETITLNGVDYVRDYDVQPVTGRAYRKTRVTVQWPS